MGLMAFVKFGYAIVVFTLLLMLWASLIRAREFHVEPGVRHPPCIFNPLCTCSKSIPDLGIVYCKSVPLFRVPTTINSSKVYMLHLESNGLRDIEPYFFKSTGLFKLAINKNPLGELPEELFLGLEWTLRELELHEDGLINVPSKALRNLQKLELLDLKGNEISTLSAESWEGLRSSLQTLILVENSIITLPRDAFTSLPMLSTLDLRGNHISYLEPTVFSSGLTRLNKLLLSDNQLIYIPYKEISPLKQLRHLDLSKNRISQLLPNTNLQGIHISLDVLRLDFNSINYLLPSSFKYFIVVNTTVLDGNPLQYIREDAFLDVKVRSLSLRDCGLTEISSAAFAGLEATLHSLDLSANNLTGLPRSLFHQFESLRYLNLRENQVHNVIPSDSFNGYQYALFNLDVSGTKNGFTSLQDLRRMRSLRSLSLSKLPRPTLMSDDFQEFGVDLDELRIIGGSLDAIQAHAFRYLRTIKLLDLSDNEISKIDKDAFIELGHGLTTFKMSNGLADSVRHLPFESLKPLSQLNHLDLSNNRIVIVSDTSFHFLSNLKRLELQDNLIEYFHKGTLQGDIHMSLESVVLSINRLNRITQHTFVDLPLLKDLVIEDNLIEKLERRSFMNLDSLRKISLKGNKLQNITEETFQNLPRLEILDLSYNQLKRFEFVMFDQVGTLGTLSVNASHNKINELSDNLSAALGNIFREPGSRFASHRCDVKILDLSHNNISFIARSYFSSAEISLTHLYLSHNKLQNATTDVFGNMPHLQILDLSYNNLFDLEYDMFRNAIRIQIINLSNNWLRNISHEIFRSTESLRVVDLSNNRLKILPDDLFPKVPIERLDLSNNELLRIPNHCFSQYAAASLVELDLSGNSITDVGSSDLLQKFRYDYYYDYDYESYPPYQRPQEKQKSGNDFQDYTYHSVKRPNRNQKPKELKILPRSEIYFKSLSLLDLSNNRIVHIEGGELGNLPRLSWLDLGHNGPFSLGKGLGTFRGIEHSLTHLGLRNVSLSSVPSLPLPFLRSLDLSYNNLPSIPSDMANNLTQLRYLDISNNDLTTVPIVTHSLTDLRWLSISKNPITTLTNTSLLGVAERLEYLDISGLRLNHFEMGALSKMQALRSLNITAYTRTRDFNLPNLLAYNSALRDLWVQVNDEKTNLGIEMLGRLPCKIQNITFSGKRLKSLADSVLSGVHNPNLRFSLRNTSITTIQRAVFAKAEKVRNITLDLRYNRISTVSNPSNGEWPGIPGKMFMQDLYLEGNPLNCDCNIGWIEVWERKRRQYLCSDELDDSCMTPRNDLRVARCKNKENRTLIDVLKNDIECGWNGSSSVEPYPNLHILYIVLAAIGTLLYL